MRLKRLALRAFLLLGALYAFIALNVIEWGPGVFGAEAAAQYHCHAAAASPPAWAGDPHA